ncbi:hypothetical protein [Hymenobacter fodinae]|uniref:Uncharacterized protein n=1 Tax=Hymenobacter fodinae TaxID=2510796 RepID=A0A4Z0P014_9BACT|nr:hypothetical protein [Hymenobacter fodinae]TGE03798.1 hypothetical protein EU556_24625 [Hymenobacter fodinae]
MAAGISRKSRRLAPLVVLAATLQLGSTGGAAAQTMGSDTTATGYLANSAEEYWPAVPDSLRRTLAYRLKHLPIRANRGFMTYCLHLRETYDN